MSQGPDQPSFRSITLSTEPTLQQRVDALIALLEYVAPEVRLISEPASTHLAAVREHLAAALTKQ